MSNAKYATQLNHVIFDTDMQDKPSNNGFSSHNSTIFSAFLQERGIAAASQRMGWVKGEGRYADGFVYPTQQSTTRRYRRVKGEGAKYGWVKGEGVKVETKIYSLPIGDLKNAIEKNNGVLYLASGEIDCLTFIEAGMDNVISFYGEGNVPEDNLHKLFNNFGVKVLINYPDCDKAGHDSLVKIATACQKVGVTFLAYELPYDMGSKKDTNDLWQDVKFDATAFKNTLQSCPPIDTWVTPIFTPSPSSQVNPYDYGYDFEAMACDIEAILTSQYGLRNGACASPMRSGNDLRKRDASYSIEKGLYDFVEGKHYNSLEVARALNIDTERYKRTPKKDKVKKDKVKGEATPTPMKDIEKVKKDAEKVATLPFTPSITMSERYITNSQRAMTALISEGLTGLRSPMGTGKSFAMKTVIEALGVKRVLWIAHRVSLVKEIAQNGLSAYSDYVGSSICEPDKLVITLDSLHRVNPDYDLVIMDEAVQGVNHLLNSSTLKGKELVTYIRFCEVMKNAKSVIALDAHLDDATMTALEQMHDGVLKTVKIMNTHRIERPITVFTHKGMALQHADNVLKHGGKVAIACTSKGTAKALSKQMGELHKRFKKMGYTVLCFHGDNSAYEQERISKIDQLRWDVLIYSPTLGTGFNILTEVDLSLTIGDRGELPANEILQIMGRVRNAKERAMWVWDGVGNRCEDASQIEAVHLERLRLGKHMLKGATLKDHLEILALASQIEAERNRLLNTPLPAVYAYLIEEGYEVTFNTEEAEYSLRDAHRAVQEEERSLAFAVNKEDYITDSEYEELRRTGKATEHAFYANRAFNIYDITGNFDELHYDLLHSKQGKKAFWNSWFYNNPTLASHKDESDIEGDVPIHKRKARQVGNEYFDAVIRCVWGVNGVNELQSVKDEYSEDQITERLATFQYREYVGLNGFTTLLEVIFNRQRHHSKGVIPQLRWLLKQFGVKVASNQVMTDAKRFMVYSIDGESIAVMNQLVQERVNYVATKNRIEDVYTPILVTPSQNLARPSGTGYMPLPTQSYAPMTQLRV